jgi:hypothetical protein
MAVLVTAIHDFDLASDSGVDARAKPAHDG